MNYKAEFSDNFKKGIKRLVKKCCLLKSEIANLITELGTNPTKGTSLNNNIYKIRLAITLKSKRHFQLNKLKYAYYNYRYY